MSYRFRHKHGNHLPKRIRQKIQWVDTLPFCSYVKVGREKHHHHNNPHGYIVFKNETETGGLACKLFTCRGSVDLYLYGDKQKILTKVIST